MRPLAEAPARVHGGLRDEELAALGLEPSAVVDFSVNTNPYGPCPAVRQAVHEAAIDRYPDPTAAGARAALAGTLGVGPDEIALGNGAADLLWTLARLLLAPGAPVVVVEPTFGELRAAAETMGARVVAWRARARDGFAIELPAASALARVHGARALYLCAPNTPTGAAVPVAAVASSALAHPDLTFVLDQSFLSLSEAHGDAAAKLPANVIRVRSLTKEHAIPGVRVGYLVAAAALVRRLEASRPAWTTSAAAQAAAIAACGQTAFVAESRERLLRDRARLAAMLREMGLVPLPSTTTFLLVPVPVPAAVVRDRLLRHHGMLVRDCTSFGLPDHVRLAARPGGECARLVAALGAELRRVSP